MSESLVNPFSMVPLIRHHFDTLHQNEILYCHWKSNPNHIQTSFTGESDVDVLFDERQKEKVVLVLESIGFKKFNVVLERQYLDIEDFVKLDFETGKLIHLHTHYRLTMGPLFFKNYQLGLERELLASRIYYEQYGIYGTTAAFQLLILFCNEALKFRMRDVLSVYFRKKTKYGEKVMLEYNWLKARTSDEELQKLLITVFGNHAYANQLMSNGFNKRQLLKFRTLLIEEFSQKRVYSSAQAALTRWRNELIINARKVIKHFIQPVLNRRINPRGGVIVAVIGADGSGKSTVTTDIRSTFEKKLDVSRIYFGRGDGRISIARKVLRKIKSILLPGKKSKIKGKSTKMEPVYSNEKKGFLATMYKTMEALLVANEKRANLKRMNIAKQKGMLVICDRFPQNQIMGYNDGPLLNHLAHSGNPFFRMFARIEAGVYKKAESNPPDLLIKLIADAAIVEKRKPGETLLEKLEAKIEGIKQLKMNESCTVITIDASQPLDEVLRKVREEIWNKL